jgi:hypothetical protein
MIRYQYAVTTRATRKQAWHIFSDWQRWHRFADIYGQLDWREGRPWEPGSRMEIEIVKPVKTVISHVITSCKPEHKVGWIDHALGVVLAQWVHFEEQIDGSTRVHTWGDIVHSGVSIAGRTVEQLVSGFTRTWYENFRVACDQFAGSGCERCAESGD